MEKQEEEKYTTFHSPSADESPPPRFHLPDSSPPDSPLSYQTSHAFSPKEDKPPPTPPARYPSPVVVVNRSVRDEPKMVTKVDRGALDGIASIAVEEGGEPKMVTKVDRGAVDGIASIAVEEGGEPKMVTKVDRGAVDGIASIAVEEGASARRGKLSLSILQRSKRERAVERAALVFRICGFLFCLISFSIMASDKNKGWTLDSFDRYMEFRYCLSVNVIGFVYSGLQGCDLAYHMGTGERALRHHLRRHLDFFMDQGMTYLLISASSSAATRVEDWKSNWGEDKFPEMARASVWMSFLAFLAFAFISVISGYILFTFPSI